MAKKLNPDGIPTDIPSVSGRKRGGLFRGLTRGGRSKPARQGSGDAATAGPSVSRPNTIFPDEPPTRPATRPPRGPTPGPGPLRPRTDEPRTKIAGGWRSRIDPVVGWLVIIEGPGKGSAIQIGNGQNSVGRGAGARVRIDFGDPEISRERHATVTYDPKHNKFYIGNGDGPNMTYLDGDPVLAPTPLNSRSTLSIGRTTLRFVAFCDQDFSWQAQEQEGAGERQ